MNPFFKKTYVSEYDATTSATFNGALFKTLLLTILTIVGGSLAFSLLVNNQIELLATILPIAVILTLISSLIGLFAPRTAPVMSVIYAASEGVLLGTITVLVDWFVQPGIGLTALVTTGVIFLVTLLAYKTGLIRVGSLFYKIMLIASIAILLSSLSIFTLYLIVPASLAFFNDPSFIMIFLVIEGVLLLYGVGCLVLDFERARYVEGQGISKVYEWNLALGMMFSIVYIYIRVLRILLLLARKK